MGRIFLIEKAKMMYIKYTAERPREMPILLYRLIILIIVFY
jgi:hypothetical protein